MSASSNDRSASSANRSTMRPYFMRRSVGLAFIVVLQFNGFHKVQMLVNKFLITQAYLPIRIFLSKSFDGFFTWNEFCHVKVEGIEDIIVGCVI